ncbi:MAG: GH3 auxin-responsive promoter family protein, partial [Bacteroidia bacterium]|nr:GH3 auxin-responsive promoter family protein [Bacteroidia bacterium]
MALINSLMSWIMKNRIHQMELFIRYPHDVQAEWLSRLLNEAQHTEWGKKFDYKSIETKEVFK